MEQINKDGTRRELTNFNVQMIALGGAIGTGLFLGAGQTIHRTGPSILLVYLDCRPVLFSNDAGHWRNDV